MLTVLAGGTGSAKLVRGLSQYVSNETITIIVNVGDNISMHGLYICPDIDTILYTLSGLLDIGRGWGVNNDTFHFLEQASIYGIDDWFKLGDRDLATHIFRTLMMKKGMSLSEVTKLLTKKMKIKHEVLPASDQHIETRIETLQGEIHIQEFWVKLKGEPEVLGVRYHGPRNPIAAPGVLDAIREARRIIICPANPVTSIGPITYISSIKEALIEAKDNVVAVSPIKGKNPVSGPAGKLLRSIGSEVTPRGVAALYSDFLGRIIIDKSDKELCSNIRRIGVKTAVTNIIMNNMLDEKKLGEFVANG